jgi:hypothetical protein
MDFNYVDLLLLSVQKILAKVFENSCFECLQILAHLPCVTPMHPLKKVCLRRFKLNGLMRKSWGATADLEKREKKQLKSIFT